MRLTLPYLTAALVLFTIEVLIAIFVRDGFVRPYVGDVLAVMLVYSALRAVLPIGAASALTAALGLAFAIEAAQAFGLVGALGLTGNNVARIVLGGAFDWLDILAYTVSAALITVAEVVLRRVRSATP